MKKQNIAVGGVLIIDGRALMIRRAAHEYSSAGYWEFPKGAVEWGETPEEALKREFLEESNLHIELGRVHNIYSHTYRHHGGDDIHFWEVEYLVRLSDGESVEKLALSDDHDAYKFIGLDEAKTIQKMYDDKRASLLRALSV